MSKIEPSSDFSRELLEKMLHSPEKPSCDFKQEVIRLDTDEKRDKFIRHLVAFANTARRTGKPCHIIFGVSENGQNILYDTRDQFASKNEPEYWSGDKVSIHKKQTDGIQEVYLNIATDFIDPQCPDIELHYGIFHDIFLSYLEIKPSYTKTPFQTKKPISRYPAKTVFMRYGSRSLPLNPEEADSLASASEIVYLKPVKWRDLIHFHLVGKFKEESERPKIDLLTTNGDSLISAVLQALSDNAKSILVVGAAGSGKSVFLRYLASILASHHNLDALASMPELGYPDVGPVKEQVSIKDLEGVPSEKIPLYIELRELSTFNSVEEIDTYLIKQISEILQVQIKSRDALINTPETRWIFLVDGLDEIRNREKVAPIFREWVQLLPKNVQIVLTSRPHCVEENLCQAFIELAPLKDIQVDELIKLRTTLRDAVTEYELAIYDEICSLLGEKPELYEVFRRLRSLDGLIAFFSSRDNFLARNDQDDVVPSLPRKFSPKTYSKVLGTSTSKLPVVKASDLISSGVLEYDEDGGDDSNLEFFYNLGLAIRSVVDYLCKVEVKRQAEFGINAALQSEKSLYKLSKISWVTNWDNLRFKYDGDNDDILSWSEFIGFMKRERYPFFLFSDIYLRCFFAADYGCRVEEEELARKAFIQNREKLNFSIVFELFNDLRISNGMQPIEIETRSYIWTRLIGLFKMTKTAVNL